MPRPICPRIIEHEAPSVYFKPAGIPMRDLAEITLASDELEAVRLADHEGLYRIDAAQRMGVSRQTFDRILKRARQRIAHALVLGRALRIEKPTDATTPATP